MKYIMNILNKDMFVKVIKEDSDKVQIEILEEGKLKGCKIWASKSQLIQSQPQLVFNIA